jgi:hypothetical protein
MTTPYLVDPDNADYVSGRTAQPPGTAVWIKALLIGVPLLLASIGLLFGLLSAGDIRQWQALEEDGISTTAQYTRLPRTEFGYTGKVSGAEYRFTVDDKAFVGSHAISNTVLVGTHEGDPVAIRYLPLDPSVSAPLDGDFPSGFLTTAVILLAVASVYGYASFKLAIGGGGKRWQAARVVRGEVVSVTELEESNTGQLELTYVFKSPLTKENITRQHAISSARDAPEPGRAIAVRFLSDDEFYLL